MLKYERNVKKPKISCKKSEFMVQWTQRHPMWRQYNVSPRGRTRRTIMTLVILAAGMGSRYGGLKQLDPITDKGNFIIDFSIYDAIRAGFEEVIFIIKKENYEIFRETIGSRVEKKIKVTYVFQDLNDIPEGLLVNHAQLIYQLFRFVSIFFGNTQNFLGHLK